MKHAQLKMGLVAALLAVSGTGFAGSTGVTTLNGAVSATPLLKGETSGTGLKAVYLPHAGKTTTGTITQQCGDCGGRWTVSHNFKAKVSSNGTPSTAIQTQNCGYRWFGTIRNNTYNNWSAWGLNASSTHYVTHYAEPDSYDACFSFNSGNTVVEGWETTTINVLPVSDPRWGL